MEGLKSMERNSRRDGFWKGFSIVLLVVLVAVVGLMYFQSQKPTYSYHESRGGGITSHLASLVSGNSTPDSIYWVSDLAEKSLPFVVNIQTSIKPSAARKLAAQNNGDDDAQRMMEQMQQMLPF